LGRPNTEIVTNPRLAHSVTSSARASSNYGTCKCLGR